MHACACIVLAICTFTHIHTHVDMNDYKIQYRDNWICQTDQISISQINIYCGNCFFFLKDEEKVKLPPTKKAQYVVGILARPNKAVGNLYSGRLFLSAQILRLPGPDLGLR